jgi:hypothetical protein
LGKKRQRSLKVIIHAKATKEKAEIAITASKKEKDIKRNANINKLVKKATVDHDVKSFKIEALTKKTGSVEGKIDINIEDNNCSDSYSTDKKTDSGGDFPNEPKESIVKDSKTIANVTIVNEKINIKSQISNSQPLVIKFDLKFSIICELFEKVSISKKNKKIK